MKLIKMALLAATAAVAATALIGVSSASATPDWIGLCKGGEHPLLNCEDLVDHPATGELLVLAGSGYFQASVKVACESGHGTGTVEEGKTEQQGAFEATLTSLNFSGCTGCNVQVLTPQPVTLDMTEETGDWRLKSNNAKVNFTGCFGFLSCEFEGNLNLSVQMDGEGAYADPEGAEFERVGGSSLCGNTGKWEEGRTRVDWNLGNGTIHKIWPSLIGDELIEVP